MRTLVETQVLVGERGALPPGAAARTRIQVPADRAGGARRAHRPAPARGQAAAADRRGHRQGRARSPLLQAIAGAVRGRRCAAGSAASRRRSSSTRRALFPELEYTFKHALTHEVAYGSLLAGAAARAARAHRGRDRAALPPDRLAEHVERLAHHALRGELWEKAVVYLRQAGAKAVARSALPDAAA